jgi:tetratricopeptide (TPR) repeat protein
MLGYCYLGLREHDEAISAFEKLIEVAPDDANSYDSMAEGHYIKGDTAAAIQYYEKSLATDSTFSNPCYMLGRIYGELGRRDRATEYLERYLELDPDGFWSRNAQNLLERLNSTPPNRDEPKE